MPKDRFVDDTEYASQKTEKDLHELSSLRAQLEIVGIKVDHYANQIDYLDIEAVSQMPQQPSTAYLKAFKAITLILKAFTKMSPDFK